MSDLTILANVVRGIRQRIIDGTWPPGSQLPTRDDLAQIFQASSSTVQVAIRSLVADGSIVTRKRAGSFVCNTPPECSRFILATSSHGLGDPKKTTNFIDALHEAAARVSTLHPGLRMDSFHGGDPCVQEMIQANAIAGIMYFGPPHERPQVGTSGIPMAAFYFPGQHVVGDVSISMDYRSLLVVSLRILCRRGHTKIAIFDAGGYYPSDLSGQRLGAQMDHMIGIVAAFGGTCAPGWIQLINSLNPLAVYQTTILLLKNVADRPRSIVLLDDIISCLRCAKRLTIWESLFHRILMYVSWRMTDTSRTTTAVRG